jgi:hypothetical protein
MVVQVLLTSMAVLQAAPFPSKDLSRDLVAFFAGRQSGSSNSGFKCDLAAASRAGHIVYPDSSTVRLTPAGLASLGAVVKDPPQSNEEIHDYLIQVLEGRRTKQLIAFLADGQTHSRESVARELGFTGAHVRPSAFRVLVPFPIRRLIAHTLLCSRAFYETILPDFEFQVLLR